MDGVPDGDVTSWTYDRFGNRTSEVHTPPNSPSEPMQYYRVGRDNPLLGVSDHIHSNLDRRYLTDQAGQRLAVLDHNTGVFGLWGVSTWTAAGQLYYSMTPEAPTGPYDHVWNWYDGSGRRFMTHLPTTTQRALDGANPDSTVGFRTYYVYDGSDVAFTLVRPSTGTTWRIQQRYVNTGLDENVAARLWLNGTPTSLALVTDRQGGYIMGVRNNGTEETSTGFYLRNAFGKMESGSTAASSLETHTGLGFAGAGTPTSAGGGYVYLRNRWYDPQTGRFLSQDPIGLAGGVNLYAYAGNNPVAYSDPFGLCPPEWMCQLIASFVANHPKAAAAASTLIDQEVAGFACGSQAFQNCQVPPSGTAGALAGQLMLALSVRAPVGGAAGGVGGAALADESVVVRGGTGDVPPPGTTFSGAAGTTLEDAASGVPHGTIRATTAGRIRQAGGTVESAPELTRGGTLNEKHVNICLGGGPCPFGDPMPNPVPKSGRVK